jgi:hypothetical protein
MDRDQMLSLFEAHREAEAARDIDGILKTFVPDPFLETNALGLRSEGREAVRAAYEMQFFSGLPRSCPCGRGDGCRGRYRRRVGNAPWNQPR